MGPWPACDFEKRILGTACWFPKLACDSWAAPSGFNGAWQDAAPKENLIVVKFDLYPDLLQFGQV